MGLTNDQLFDCQWYLSKANNWASIALCEMPDGYRYFSTYPVKTANKDPYCAGTVLIQGLLSIKGVQDRLQGAKIVISPDYLAGKMLKGMIAGMTNDGVIVLEVPQNRASPDVKTASLAQNDPDQNHELFMRANDLDFNLFNCSYNQPINSPGFNLSSLDQSHRGVHQVYMMAAFALLKKYDQKAKGRYVAAILVNTAGRIIGWGINTNYKNSSYHAEVNMLQSYWAQLPQGQSGIPEGCRIYSTLQCCKMCAGMIFENALKLDSIHVYYGMSDPTATKGGTALNRHESRLDVNTNSGVKGLKIIIPGGNVYPDLARWLDQQYTHQQDEAFDRKRSTGTLTGGSTASDFLEVKPKDQDRISYGYVQSDVYTALTNKQARHFPQGLGGNRRTQRFDLQLITNTNSQIPESGTSVVVLAQLPTTKGGGFAVKVFNAESKSVFNTNSTALKSSNPQQILALTQQLTSLGDSPPAGVVKDQIVNKVLSMVPSTSAAAIGKGKGEFNPNVSTALLHAMTFLKARGLG
jgi:tRNA(Arg) A34 adenosine deaminase TadA